jgi:Zn-finger nucleic acid-binding protein
MNPVDLAPELSGLACSECSGVWIPRHKYDAWRARQPADLPETPTAAQVAVSGTHKAKICPQCGHLLLPYRVGHGLPISIDYCGACGGVWCDRAEWDAMKARNLHDNLHDMVSAHWQTAVRQSDVQEAVEQTYRRLLGAEYGKASELRAWLRDQPQKSLILAYLSGVKPDAR